MVAERNIFSEGKFVAGGVFLLTLWAAYFWQGIITAFDIWIGNDIFNHCLLVIPGSFYLIYLKRSVLPSSEVRPNFWVLPFLVGCLLLYLVGIAGDVQLFMHAATFSFLPFAVWMLLGNTLAYKVTFPLFFMLFAIPFGEELVPFLQEVTADWSVFLLNVTGVPIYRSGLYIEIPQGRFLVAEACSGISFFIASIVIGSLYAYLNIYSWKRKVSFVILSIMFPVVANAIRVYGIILTGYLTDMEHAVGADHIIYGWFFFAFVILCLLGIGELVREKEATESPEVTNSDTSKSMCVQRLYVALAVNGALVIGFYAWLVLINGQLQPSKHHDLTFKFDQVPDTITEQSPTDWDPKFKHASYEFWGIIEQKNIDIYLAWYPKGQGELISSLNRLYHEKQWTLEGRKQIQVQSELSLTLSTIVNSQYKRLLTYWYVIDGDVYTDKHIAKLAEIKNILLGVHKGSGIVAVSTASDQISYKDNQAKFVAFVNESFAELNQSFVAN